MERTPDTLLLALYALPDPTDGRLVNRRAAVVEKQQQRDGGAASRAVEDAASRGMEAAASLNPACVSRETGPLQKGKTTTDEPACGCGVEEVSCDGSAPHANRRLEATRKGCREGAAGERFLVDDRRCEEDRPCGGRPLRTSRRPDPIQKGYRARAAGERSLSDEHSFGHNAEEKGPCSGDHGDQDQVILNLNLDTAGSAVADSVACCGVNYAPCSRYVKIATCGSGDCGHPFHGSGPLNVCRGLKEDAHCGRKAGLVPVECHTKVNTSRPAAPVYFQADLGVAPQHKSASTSTSCSTATSNVDPYDPTPELLLCGGEVLSSPWREIWRNSPLILHDKSIARYLLKPKGVLLDLTEMVTSILEKHPGDVDYFRLDSSRWSGGRTQLSEWLKKLSQKNACEIIIVNRIDDPRTEFPLEDVQSSCLRSLRIAFFAISELDLYCFEYNNLTTLDLMGCAFETHRLYHVVKDCKSLTHLGIGLAMKNVRIYSESLEQLQIWRCSMTHMSIEYAPNLQIVVNGVRPPWKGQSVLVMVQGTPALVEFDILLLPLHKVEDRFWLRTLRKIKLGIQMACNLQRKAICEYIQSAPALKELVIWRMDDIGVSEELDAVIDDSLDRLTTGLSCFKSLQDVQIEDFRGGEAEIQIAATILKYAVGLEDLSVSPYHDSCGELVAKAYMRLRRMKPASVNCSVSLRGNALS